MKEKENREKSHNAAKPSGKREVRPTSLKDGEKKPVEEVAKKKKSTAARGGRPTTKSAAKPNEGEDKAGKTTGKQGARTGAKTKPDSAVKHGIKDSGKQLEKETTRKNDKPASRQNSKQPTRGTKTQGKQTKPVENTATKKQAEANANKAKKTIKNLVSKEKTLKVIPLGGLKEIGKNMTAFEYGNDIIIIDCGLSFPDDEMLGIDIVIPDFDYLIKNKKKVRGLVITHGHEDHIGGIPYLLKSLKIPVYGTRLPIALVEGKFEEHNMKPMASLLNTIKAGDTFKVGPFKVNAIRTTHSIADAVALAIDTPIGTIFHTGDFKIDFTPVDGEPIDLRALGRLGDKGVLLMLADSTNATREGFTKSEKRVGEALESIFRTAESRILVATFSSNVHRIQKIIDNAVLCGRKVVFTGRSMLKVADVATELGYLDFPPNTVLDMNQVNQYPDNEVVIITTGSQGEPMSALSRMANQTHRDISIKEGDMVILSSTPVPGNEKTVTNVVNNLIEAGAKVIYSDIAETHVSGHAKAEELKIIHSLIKPKYFMPVHGERMHLKKHAELAVDLGLPEENAFILNNGDILNINSKGAHITEDAVSCETIMVDGLGVGDIGTVVLRDRKLLSESGLVIVVTSIDTKTGRIIGGPEIVSRGFVYVKENEDLIKDAREVAMASVEKCRAEKIRDWASMKSLVRDDMRKFIYDKTKRNPVILPIFMEV